MNNSLFDLNVYEIYQNEIKRSVVYNDEQHKVLRHIRYGILFHLKSLAKPFLTKEDNPKKFEELLNEITKSNQENGFINPKGIFRENDKLFSIHQLTDYPHISTSYKSDGKFYIEFFTLKLNQLDLYQVKDFLSYHYQKFDGNYIDFLEVIIENEGKVFWNDKQIDIIKSWLQNPIKPKWQPTIIDEVLNLGKDVTRIKRNFIKSLDYLHNKQVFKKIIEFTKEDTQVKISEYRRIINGLERQCSIFEKNVEVIKDKLKKAKLQSLKDENCQKCEYYNLLLEDKEYLLEVLKRCEYDEVAENHLLEAWRKLIEETKIPLTSKEALFKVNYGVALWVELGYVYQTGDSVFLEYLIENIQNPVLMVKDTNVFIESHTKYLSNKLFDTNEDTGFDKIKNELQPIYKQVESNDYDLLLAASIRQTEPKELKAFLTYHYNKYDGDFNEFLETCLMVYEQYINPVNIKITKQWLLSDKPNPLKVITKIGIQPPEGFRLIPIGTKTQEDIKHFFSFLYSEKNGDDMPFMKKSDVEEMLRFGFGIYEEPIKHYEVDYQKDVGILKYCFYKLYKSLEIRTVKDDITLFLIQNFKCFADRKKDFDKFKNEIRATEPKKIDYQFKSKIDTFYLKK